MLTLPNSADPSVPPDATTVSGRERDRAQSTVTIPERHRCRWVAASVVLVAPRRLGTIIAGAASNPRRHPIGTNKPSTSAAGDRPLPHTAPHKLPAQVEHPAGRSRMLVAVHGLAVRSASDAIRAPLTELLKPDGCRAPPPSSRRAASARHHQRLARTRGQRLMLTLPNSADPSVPPDATTVSGRERDRAQSTVTIPERHRCRWVAASVVLVAPRRLGTIIAGAASNPRRHPIGTNKPSTSAAGDRPLPHTAPHKLPAQVEHPAGRSRMLVAVHGLAVRSASDAIRAPLTELLKPDGCRAPPPSSRRAASARHHQRLARTRGQRLMLTLPNSADPSVPPDATTVSGRERDRAQSTVTIPERHRCRWVAASVVLVAPRRLGTIIAGAASNPRRHPIGTNKPSTSAAGDRPLPHTAPHKLPAQVEHPAGRSRMLVAVHGLAVRSASDAIRAPLTELLKPDGCRAPPPSSRRAASARHHQRLARTRGQRLMLTLPNSADPSVPPDATTVSGRERDRAQSTVTIPERHRCRWVAASVVLVAPRRLGTIIAGAASNPRRHPIGTNKPSTSAAGDRPLPHTAPHKLPAQVEHPAGRSRMLVAVHGLAVRSASDAIRAPLTELLKPDGCRAPPPSSRRAASARHHQRLARTRGQRLMLTLPNSADPSVPPDATTVSGRERDRAQSTVTIPERHRCRWVAASVVLVAPRRLGTIIAGAASNPRRHPIGTNKPSTSAAGDRPLPHTAPHKLPAQVEHPAGRSRMLVAVHGLAVRSASDAIRAPLTELLKPDGCRAPPPSSRRAASARHHQRLARTRGQRLMLTLPNSADPSVPPDATTVSGRERDRAQSTVTIPERHRCRWVAASVVLVAPRRLGTIIAGAASNPRRHPIGTNKPSTSAAGDRPLPHTAPHKLPAQVEHPAGRSRMLVAVHGLAVRSASDAIRAPLTELLKPDGCRAPPPSSRRAASARHHQRLARTRGQRLMLTLPNSADPSVPPDATTVSGRERDRAQSTVTIPERHRCRWVAASVVLVAPRRLGTIIAGAASNPRRHPIGTNKPSTSAAGDRPLPHTAPHKLPAQVEHPAGRSRMLVAVHGLAVRSASDAIRAPLTELLKPDGCRAPPPSSRRAASARHHQRLARTRGQRLMLTLPAWC